MQPFSGSEYGYSIINTQVCLIGIMKSVMDPCVMTVADPSIFLQAAACINISVAFVQSGTQIPVNIPVERCHLSLCPDSSSALSIIALFIGFIER